MTTTFQFKSAIIPVLMTASTLISACGGGSAGSGTSFWGGGEKQVAAQEGPPPVSNDPTTRTMQVAWTAARARKCGFYFDPNKLKSTLMAYESRQGLPAPELAKLQQTYDYTLVSVTSKIKDNEDYCTPAAVDEIRADLKRNLAGDFTPRAVAPKIIEEG